MLFIQNIIFARSMSIIEINMNLKSLWGQCEVFRVSTVCEVFCVYGVLCVYGVWGYYRCESPVSMLHFC